MERGDRFPESCAYINLAYNRISQIEARVFPVSLEVLRLEGNKLVRVKDDTFEDLSNLIELDLAENEIMKIDGGAFSDLHSLERLFLNDNKLDELSQETWEGLVNLNELWLSNNNLVAIPDDGFRHLATLRKLYLANNRIERVTPETWNGLETLVKLDLHNNNLASLPSLPDDAFQPLTNLEELILSNNRLEEIDNQMWHKLLSLHTVIGRKRNP